MSKQLTVLVKLVENQVWFLALKLRGSHLPVSLAAGHPVSTDLHRLFFFLTYMVHIN